MYHQTESSEQPETIEVCKARRHKVKQLFNINNEFPQEPDAFHQNQISHRKTWKEQVISVVQDHNLDPLKDKASEFQHQFRIYTEILRSRVHPKYRMKVY